MKRSSAWLAAVLVALAVAFDLVIQAPPWSFLLSVIGLVWLFAGAVRDKRRDVALRVGLRGRVPALLLSCAYAVSVCSGLLVARLVLDQAQALRDRLIDVHDADAAHHAMADFCAARITHRCGLLDYRLIYSPPATFPGGEIVVFQYFGERATLDVVSGLIAAQRSID